MILFEEVPAVVQKYENFCKALTILNEADAARTSELIYRVGIIRWFEICFELSWKALREVLLLHGVAEASSGSPREIIKAGYKFNFISDEETWLDMLKRRNQATHIYNEDIALELVAAILDKYVAAFVNLRDELQRRITA